MRFTLIVLSAASLALAAPQNAINSSHGYHQLKPRALPGPKATRSAKTIMGALGQVTTSVDGLDAAVLKVKGTDNIKALTDLATKGEALGDTIKAAQAKILTAEETDLGGAVGIQDSASSLGKSLERLSSDLISIEPVVRKAGLDSAVVAILKQQQTNSAGLVGTVTEKLPKLAQGLAKEQTAGVTKSLTRVIDAYEAGTDAAPAKSPKSPAKSDD